jgi:tetratricopeptide (TPR) repeat protein
MSYVKRMQVMKVVVFVVTLLWITVAVNGQTVQSKSADDYFAEGVGLQQAGEHEKALEAYRAVLKLNPKHFGAQVNSGVSYMALEKYEDAVGAVYGD